MLLERAHKRKHTGVNLDCILEQIPAHNPIRPPSGNYQCWIILITGVAFWLSCTRASRYWGHSKRLTSRSLHAVQIISFYLLLKASREKFCWSLVQGSSCSCWSQWCLFKLNRCFSQSGITSLFSLWLIEELPRGSWPSRKLLGNALGRDKRTTLNRSLGHL